MKRLALFALTLAMSGCAFVAPASTSSRYVPVASAAKAPRTKIAHVVIIIQENRSFDNLFATFPGADGATSGLSRGKRVPLRRVPLAQPFNLGHTYAEFRDDYDGGKMDGFNTNPYEGGTSNGMHPYQYTDPAKIGPYVRLAKDYVLADRLFQTQGSGSFTAHQDLIAGSSMLSSQESVIDFPLTVPWGCDNIAYPATDLITKDNHYLPNAGPKPCFDYTTLADLLDTARIGWRYYSPAVDDGSGAIWSAFDAIAHIRYSKFWSNVLSPQTRVISDARNGQLPAVTWVVPDAYDSDHPGYVPDRGPSWVGSIVNAIGHSKNWDSTAVVIVWDDWGGYYDHVKPPRLDFGGLGFRVPMIVVSPYAKAHHVSHTQYEFASILKWIEDNWGLPRIGPNDVRATSIADCFDFTQPPRPFHTVAAPIPTSFFERERPSGLPVDDQ